MSKLEMAIFKEAALSRIPLLTASNNMLFAYAFFKDGNEAFESKKRTLTTTDVDRFKNTNAFGQIGIISMVLFDVPEQQVTRRDIEGNMFEGRSKSGGGFTNSNDPLLNPGKMFGKMTSKDSANNR